ncbi:MAG: hypothetical protein ACT4NX_01685 [Deltaproteobacteria bacterium]
MILVKRAEKLRAGKVRHEVILVGSKSLLKYSSPLITMKRFLGRVLEIVRQK